MKTTGTIAAWLAVGLIVTALLCASGTAQADLLTDLQGYWAFEETSGTTAADSHTTGVNLGLQGNTTQNWTTGGALGGGFNFSGDQYFRSPTNGDVPLANKSFTVQYWGKRSISSHESWAIGHSDDGNNRSLHLGHRGGADQNFAFWGNDMGWGVAEANDQTAFHHWAFVYDTAANTRTIYLDGGTAAGGTQSTQTGVGTDFQGTEQFQIGARNYDNGNAYHGVMDEVAVWGRPLTATEVSDLYNGGTPLNFFISGTLTSVKDGSWNAVDTWDHGSQAPTADYATIVLDDTVTVASNGAANSLQINDPAAIVQINSGRTLTIDTNVNHDQGSLHINGTLDVKGTLNGAGGSSFSADGAKLNVGPGASTMWYIDAAANGTSTVEVGDGGTMTAEFLILENSASTFVKAGEGLLTVTGNLADTIEAGTVRADAGELKMHANSNPMGGGDLTLNGGLFTVKGPQTVTANTLHMTGYMNGGRQDSDMDFSAGGGLLADTPVGQTSYSGQLDINGDGAFRALIPEITRDDDYQTAFVGQYTVAPGDAGAHRFEMANKDDKTVIWLDLDQDGVFSHTGAAGDEQMFGLDNGNRTVTLAAGDYNVAFGHMEHGGGSRIRALVQTPSLSNRVINPSDGAQAGMWADVVVGDVDMTDTDISVTAAGSRLKAITPGSAAFGSLTFDPGTDLTTSGADTSFTRIDVPAAGSATLINETNVTTSNFGDGGTATTFGKAGAGTLTLDNSGSGLSAADTTFDVSAGTLVVAGPNPLGGSDNLVLSGGTADFTGAVTAASGIKETIFNDTISNAQDNIEAFRTAAQSIGASDGQGLLTSHLHYNDDNAVSTRAAALGATGFDNGNFAMLWVTDFTPTETGAWGFRFNHEDDNASFWVDTDQNGTFESGNRFYNRGCCGGSGDQFTSSLTLGQTYKLGIVMNDTGGGGDFRDMEFKSPTGGWTDLDPGASSLFQTAATAAINQPDLNIDVTADSRLQANSDAVATFGHLKVQKGVALTTGGTAPGITFNETILPTGSSPAAEAMVVTFKPEVPTTLTGTVPLTNNSSGPDTVRLVAAGTSDLILSKAPTPGTLSNVTLEAQSGRLKIEYGSDPTDGADLLATGGTITAQGAQGTGYAPGRLNYAYYNDAAANNLQNIDNGVDNDATNGGLFSLTPTPEANWPTQVQGKAMWTGEVWQGGDMSDTYGQMWSGRFKAPATGPYEFYVHGDDYEILWIDLDGDHDFEASNNEDISRNVEGEQDWNTPHTETVVLQAGQTYDFALAHSEGGGGDWVNITIKKPDGTAERINPSAASQQGWWSGDGPLTGAIDMQNKLTVDNPALNGLRHLGYHINNDGLAMDLNNNGGVMGGGDPTSFQTFQGEMLLTTGPGGRGLNFDNDTDFINTGVIGQNDNYSNLFTGTFTAPETGSYGFRMWERDDPVGMWIDLDQDGVFESTVAGLGNNRGEQLAWDDRRGEYFVDLEAGEEYMVGFTHREGGGGSQIDIQFRTPSVDWRTIQPADGAQAGLWSVTPTSTLELITDLGANLKELVLKNGDLRITGGNLLTIERASISSATSGKVGLITDTDTILTQVAGFDGNGQTATFTKGGTADLIMNKAGTGLDDVTFSVKGGRLIGVHASNPFGAADIVLDGGGVVLGSAGGDVTYDNVVTVKSDSTLTAGAAGGGASGPLDVTLGNATTGIALNGGVLTAQTTDGYRLVVPGPVTGPGGIDFAGGSVKTEQGVSAGSVALSGATLETPADVTATGSLTLKGGTLRSSGFVNVTGSSVSISGKPNLDVQSGHLTIPAPMGTAVLPGTLGAWRFDGDTAADSSGNGYDGVRSGGSYSSDVPPALAGGRSVDLNGNGYISVDDGAGQTVFDLDELSVAFWTKEWPSSGWGQHVSKRGEGGQGWAVRRNGGSADAISWTLRGPGNDDWNAVSTVNDDQWHHVVATYGDGKRRLYQDGVLIGEEDRSGGINDASGYLLVFGARDDGGIGNFANVRLDDVYILDRVIDASEVADLYNNNLLPEVAAFGDLTMAAGSELTLGGAGVASFENISAGGGATIHGDVEAKSSVAVGSSVGTLNIDGDYTQGAGSTYKWETDFGESDTIAATGNVDASADWNLEVTPLNHEAAMNNEVLMSGGSADAPGTVIVSMSDNVYQDLYDVGSATVAKDGNNIVLNGVTLNDKTTSYGGTWPTSGDWDNGVPDTSKAAVVAGGTVGSVGGTAKDLVVAGGDLHHNANTLAVRDNVRIGADSELKISGPTTTVTVGNEAKVYDGGTLHLENGGQLGSTVKIQGGGTLKTSGDMDLQDNVEFEPTGNLHVAAGTLRVAGGGGLPTGNVLHLKADDLALSQGDPVASWADASPSGIIVAQGDGGRQPIYQASVASLGGQPAVRFDADALTAPGGNSTGITGDHDLTLITVWSDAQGTGQNYQHTLHMGNTGTREAYGHSVSRGGNNGEIGNHYWGDGWNSSSTDGLGNPIIALSTYDSATDQDTWWVNGNPEGFRDLAPDGGLNIGNQQLHIGSRLDPFTEGIRGNVAEVLVFDRVLTPDEMNAVGGYLADKYSIGTTYDGGLGTKFGNLAVDRGATLLNAGTGALRFNDVSGGGTVDSDVKIGGQASPGDGSGTLNVTGDLVLEDGASYLWELGARSYDSILVGGDLAFDGDWTLVLADAGGTASPDDMFYLFDGSFPTIDLDTIEPMLDLTMVDPVRWDPSSLTFGVDNRGVFMTGLRVGDIPEPATMAMLSLALAGLGGYIRRRRRA